MTPAIVSQRKRGALTGRSASMTGGVGGGSGTAGGPGAANGTEVAPTRSTTGWKR